MNNNQFPCAQKRRIGQDIETQNMQKLKGNKTQTQDTTSGRSNPIKMVSEIL